MLDFTSSLYLGFHHASGEIPTWSKLTTGAASAIRRVPQADRVEEELHRLCGGEEAVIGRSTLHQFWDLFEFHCPPKWSTICDESNYPIARWIFTRSNSCGNSLSVPRFFRHLDTISLGNGCLDISRLGARPLIITDSYCCVCGRFADLQRYCEIANAFGGLVIVDDTQSLGLFGENRGNPNSFGHGGGGCMRLHSLTTHNIVAVSSLAKAFGAPISVTVGPKEIIKRLRKYGESHWHCSPPSVVDIIAAANAMKLNALHGESLRLKLATLIHIFNQTSKSFRLRTAPGMHPVRYVDLHPQVNVLNVLAGFRQKGISVLAGRSHASRDRLMFILTVQHTSTQIRESIKLCRDLICCESEISLTQSGPN